MCIRDRPPPPLRVQNCLKISEMKRTQKRVSFYVVSPIFLHVIGSQVFSIFICIRRIYRFACPHGDLRNENGVHSRLCLKSVEMRRRLDFTFPTLIISPQLRFNQYIYQAQRHLWSWVPTLLQLSECIYVYIDIMTFPCTYWRCNPSHYTPSSYILYFHDTLL